MRWEGKWSQDLRACGDGMGRGKGEGGGVTYDVELGGQVVSRYEGTWRWHGKASGPKI